MRFTFLLTLFFLTSIFPARILAHESSQSGVVRIHITTSGFDPSTVTVNQNDMVIFENKDVVDRWPASDIHPTHAIYPEFDPKKPVKPNDEWIMRFEKPGTFRLHDHLIPSFTGTITVNGSEPKPSEQPFSFEKQFAEFKKYLKIQKDKAWYRLHPGKLENDFADLDIRTTVKDQEILEYWMQIKNPDTLMHKLITDSGGGSTFDCHQEAHEMGNMAFALFKASAFEKGTAACHSGFYHGAMESFLFENGTENLASDISKLCQTFKTRFGIFECLHGVGHGVLAYTNYNLPGALVECKKLTTSFDQNSCFGGVFMENIITAQGGGAGPVHETSWVSSDPHFPCNTLTSNFDAQYQCYQMQTSWMLSLNKYDFDKVAAECMKAPENMRSVCFKSFGRDASGHVLRNPDKIIELCNKVPRGTFYKQCIVGALNVIVDFWGDKLNNQASELCKIVPIETKKLCYTTLTYRIEEIFTEEEQINSICQSFETNYRPLCKKAS